MNELPNPNGEFSLELMGKERQIEELGNYAQNLLQGKGNFVLIEGAEGIGKNALIERMKTHKSMKNTKVITVDCKPSEPYYVYNSIVNQLTGSSIFSADDVISPKLALLITRDSGMLAGRAGKSDIDEDIFSGMLTAVQSFVKDSVGTEGGLGKLEYGKDTVILIEHGEYVSMAMIAEKDHPEMRRDLKRKLADIETKYSGVLHDWKGDMRSVEPIGEELNSFIENKYRRKKDDMDIESERAKIDEVVKKSIKDSKDHVVVVLRNLENADESSLRQTLSLARSLDEMPNTMFVGSFNPNDADDSKSDYLKQIEKEGLCSKMNIGALSVESVRGFIHDKYGVDDETFIDSVYRATGGNPLFLQETMRTLYQEGKIRKEDGIVTPDMSAISLPSSVKESVLRRISGLETEEMEVIEYAAVINDEFDLSTIENISGQEHANISEALKSLEEKMMIKKGENGKFRLAPGIQDSVYDDISQRWKTARHRSVANALEKSGDTEGNLFKLAEHFGKSGNAQKAIEYNLKAGDKAYNQSSPEVAIKFYENAIPYLKDDKNEDLIDTMLKLTSCHETLNNNDSMIDICNKILEKSSKEAQRAEAYEQLGWAHSKRKKRDKGKNDLDDSLKYYEKAMELYKKLDDREKEIEILRKIGVTYKYRGDMEKAREICDMTLKMASKIENWGKITAKIENLLGTINQEEKKYDDAIKHLERAKEIYQKINDKGISTIMYNISLNHAHKYLSGEESSGQLAIEHSEKALELAKQNYRPVDEFSSLFVLGDIKKKQGNIEQAMEYLESAYKIAKRTGHRNQFHILESLGDAYRLKGNNEMARISYEKALKVLDVFTFNRDDVRRDEISAKLKTC